MNKQNNIITGAPQAISNDFIGAVLFYVGAPDGTFFTPQDFPEDVVKAKKAYVTTNTAMGGATAERDRFTEGKKQTPGLMTPLGIEKQISMYIEMFRYAVANRREIGYETVRACRQTEVSEGTSFVGALTSTTKLSAKDIMDLGYGNKLVARCVGYDDRYLDKDGKPALMYEIDVYPP